MIFGKAVNAKTFKETAEVVKEDLQVAAKEVVKEVENTAAEEAPKKSKKRKSTKKAVKE